MASYSTISATTNTEMVTDTFLGYNHNLKIGDGEFYDMKNLSSECYPLMANRAARNIVAEFDKIYGMAADGDGNIYVVGIPETAGTEKDVVKLYKIFRESPTGDYAYTYDVSADASISNSTSGDSTLHLEASPKQMMIFGNYLLIFPDKIMIRLNSTTTWYTYHGYLDNCPVRAVPCNAFGDAGAGEYVSVQFSYASFKSIPVFLGADTVRITGLGELDGIHTLVSAEIGEASDYPCRYVIKASLSEVTYYTSGEWYMSRLRDSAHSGDFDDLPVLSWQAKTMAADNRVDEATYPVTIRPCNAKGETMTGTASATAPTAKEGAIWIDTSGNTAVWKKYISTTWVTLSDVYTCVSFTAPDPDTTSGEDVQEYWPFEIGDAVKFSGIGELDGTHTIIGKGHIAENEENNSVNFWITGVISDAKTFSEGVFSMAREVPDMDFAVQAENRLWGCRYGEATGKSKDKINEIYACKLGDPTNWNVFQGISTDSYVASCGTPGAFTGAANVNGYPVFFKENCYHKVYISSSGAHQIQSKPVNGVQSGCGGSVAMVGDTCFYKSRNGVMAFDGTQAYTTGNYFGGVTYCDAVGGAVEDKYYISMRHGNTFTIFAYDTSTQLWHKEDDKRVRAFTSLSLGAFMLTNETLPDDNEAEYGNKNVSRIYAVSKYIDTNTKEDAPDWEAITGMQGYSYTGQKYITRFNLRMSLPEGSCMNVYIEYDSDGKWEQLGQIKGTGTTTFLLPVKPRRCDHFRIKLSGKGDVRLYSISKLFEGGTDIK